MRPNHLPNHRGGAIVGVLLAMAGALFTIGCAGREVAQPAPMIAPMERPSPSDHIPREANARIEPTASAWEDAAQIAEALAGTELHEQALRVLEWIGGEHEWLRRVGKGAK